MTKFEQKLAELTILQAEHGNFYNHPLNDEYKAELVKLYKTAYPKRKYNSEKVQDVHGYKELTDSFKAKADTLINDFYARKDVLEKELKELALTAEIPVSEDFTYYSFTSRSAYMSQGFGAEKYARESANMDMLIVQSFGIESKIIENPPDFMLGYMVMAKTTAAGVEIIKRKPYSMKDIVTMCAKLHVNPRVYFPTLPYEYDV